MIGHVHAEAAAQIEECEYVALCDGDTNKAELAKKLNIKYYSDYSEMIQIAGKFGTDYIGYKYLIELLSEERRQEREKELEGIEVELAKYPEWKKIEQELLKSVER